MLINLAVDTISDHDRFWVWIILAFAWFSRIKIINALSASSLEFTSFLFHDCLSHFNNHFNLTEPLDCPLWTLGVRATLTVKWNSTGRNFSRHRSALLNFNHLKNINILLLCSYLFTSPVFTRICYFRLQVKILKSWTIRLIFICRSYTTIWTLSLTILKISSSAT